ncbi:hypothetical protein SprV_0100290500 [Sparganum proliferum]
MFVLTPILHIIIAVICISMHIVNGCVKSSMHYRSQSRINSRVFIPDEYLPMQKERSLDGSGPLEPQDYQLAIPSPRLVRVDNVNIQFENEEARWMTKGCRDRLLKLVAHVQNAWPGNEVALRVTRSWQKPPAAYQTQRPATKAISNRSHPGLRHKQSPAPPPPATEGYPNGVFQSQRKRPSGYRQNADSDASVGEIDIGKSALAAARSGADVTMHRPRTNFSSVDPYTGSQDQVLQQQQQHHDFDGGYGSYPRTRDIYSRRSSYGQGGGRIMDPQSATIRMNQPRWRDDPPAPFSWSHKIDRGRGVGGYTGERLGSEKHLMMEEFHFAGRAVDMILVDTREGNPARQGRSLFPGKLAQLAYFKALFDWCFFSRDGYVHCSVKPDSIIVSQWFGCFPGAASAMSTNGSIVPLSQVKIGDTLLTYDLSKHAIQPTTVISFLHRDEHQFSTWINITFVMPSHHVSSLLLTGNHLIYRSLSRNSKTDDATSVFAKSIVPGDFIICSTNPVEAFCKVLRVSEVNGTLARGSIGVYAPLTSSGTLLVDGVLVSCYAHVRYEWLARLATLPLRIYYFLVSQMELANPSWPVEHGVHWFAELLLHFAKFILPETIFFN